MFTQLLVCCLPLACSAVDTHSASANPIGRIDRVELETKRIELVGPLTAAQLVATAHYADGTTRDVSALMQLSEANDLVELLAGGMLSPKKNGQSKVRLQFDGKPLDVQVSVSGLDRSYPVSFHREVIAALNVGGCNAGACHGTPSGKNGFRLSLRGFDPALDFVQLTHDIHGRRADRMDPEASLIWQKGLGRIPHEGGIRFTAHSLPANILQSWIRQGLNNDASNPVTVKSITVVPGSRKLKKPFGSQQLAVAAVLSDGTTRDVTQLTVFSSSDAGVASVSPTGLVEFKRSGDVAILCRYLQEMTAVRISYLEPKDGFEWTNPPPANAVDTHVYAKLQERQILPSGICTDAEFVRRAYLDLCGIIPTPQEARAFLADKNPNKRQALIESLLKRPEFDDFWTLKWADILRNQRKTVQLKGVHVFQSWLRDQIARNRPWDQVVRELITASGPAYANPPANYYRIAREPTTLAETTAQVFMGVRMQCAKCHNHPFERWTQDDYYNLAAFFARVKQKKDPLEPSANGEIIVLDRVSEVTHPRHGKTVTPRFPDGAGSKNDGGPDRRVPLADWLTDAKNPFFARSVVNRIWFHLMGRGIVEPVDDFRESNPPANEALLDWLARDFVSHGHDLRHTIRVITQSHTYETQATTNRFNSQDVLYASHALPKLLSAEQLLDAICTATSVNEKYAGFPDGTRAMQLPDGEIQHVFLKTFGQPARELACECERDQESNLAQALQLINGDTINQKIRNADNRVGKLLQAKTNPDRMVIELYLATLTREPSSEEIKLAIAHVSRAAEPRKAWEDVHWALLNSKEFLFRH